ncbi:MAG: hypothetical protein K2I26_01260 [Paramuribaculum sp.]|nr:hypothetical protein [Paramuribaculum sp.]
MWKTLSIELFFISSLPVFPKSYDERIADAMNSGDWFALDSIYNAAPKDSGFEIHKRERAFGSGNDRFHCR